MQLSVAFVYAHTIIITYPTRKGNISNTPSQSRFQMPGLTTRPTKFSQRQPTLHHVMRQVHLFGSFAPQSQPATAVASRKIIRPPSFWQRLSGHVSRLSRRHRFCCALFRFILPFASSAYYEIGVFSALTWWCFLSPGIRTIFLLGYAAEACQ